MTKVSVIIPVYNVEKYLAECLDSVLNQEYPDMEIICIDDCSTDYSKAILDKYKDRNTCIKIVYNSKNKGLSAARNIGLDFAKGKYILFLDSDDCLEKNALFRMIECAELQRAEVVSFSSRSFGDVVKSGIYNGIRKQTLSDCMNGVEVFIEQNNNGDYKCTVWQHLYNRQFLKKYKLQFIEGIYHEDIAFSFCVYMLAKRIYFINEVLHRYRIRQGSISNDSGILKERILGLLSSYHYCQEFINNLNHSLSFDEAGKIQLRCIAICIMDYYFRICHEQRKEYVDRIADEMMSPLREFMSELGILLTEEDVWRLSHEKHLFLYGMGKYAKTWLWALEVYRLNLEGVLVTSLEGNANNFFGYQVHQADEFCRKLQEPITVVMGVSKKYVKEIKAMLKNYPKIKIVDGNLQDGHIDQELLEQVTETP